MLKKIVLSGFLEFNWVYLKWVYSIWYNYNKYNYIFFIELGHKSEMLPHGSYQYDMIIMITLIIFILDGQLLPDFFLGTPEKELGESIENVGGKPRFSSGTDSEAGPEKTFKLIQSVMSDELVKSTGGIYMIKITGNLDFE